jgi:concanavalin A-like lectin/glucanase superfamily protein
MRSVRVSLACSRIAVSLVLVAAVVASPVVSGRFGGQALASGEPEVKATESQAQKAARESGAQVEVGALRGERREVFAQPDGHFTAVEHLRPVRTRKHGDWVNIDTSLQARPDGSVAAVASTVDLAFSGGGTSAMARMARAGRELSLSWPGSLPEPVLDGDTAKYTDVVDGVDLLLRAKSDGMSTLIVVKTPEAAKNPMLAQLQLGLQTVGLQVRTDAVGGLEAVDAASGGVVFDAPTPLMWDSTRPAGAAAARAAGEDPTDGPLEGAKVAEVAAGVGGGKLTLQPDQGLLSGADTAFPVYIDPDVTTKTESAWAMVSSGFPTTSYYKFNGKSTEGVGFCDVSRDGACVQDQVKRIFFRMPTGDFAGASILSAQFTAWETDAFDCSNSTVVQLWRATGFASTSTWNTTSDNWVEHLDSRDVSYCSSTPVEFDAKAAVVDAAAGKWSATTFGLRAYDETSMAWWKRFADDAALRVNYNRAPNQVPQKQLSMSPGGGCVDTTKPTEWVNDISKLTLVAKGATDPDGDQLSAQFAVNWDGGGWTSPTIGPKPSGSNSIFSLAYKTAGGPTPPQNVLLHWQVRMSDGTAWGPWSYSGSATSCYFKYDPSKPDGPVIISSDGRYPKTDPANDADPWNDGVGQYGSFTLDSVATDVTTYWFGVNTEPSAANARTTTAGAPVSIQVAPTESGLFFITAQAFDVAGNNSVTTTYFFRVAAGSPAKASWALDEPIDSIQVADGSGSFTGSVHGGVTLGVDGVDKTAMQLNGIDGYASTAAPVVDTTKSFSVAAWARLPQTKPSGAAIIATQAGAQKSGFELYYSASLDRWVFNKHDADTATAQPVRATAPTAPQGGEWAHLVGVYDAVAASLTLYVNGKWAATTAFTGAWNATGRVQIGAGSYGAQPSAFFSGEIDDVQIFNRIVSDDEVKNLATQAPVVAARWKLNNAGNAIRPAKVYYKLDEAAGASRAEDTMGAFPAGKSGGVTFGVAGKSGTAMHLDGTTGYAATSGPVLDTSKSFSVSAWAKLPATKPTHAAIIATQAGTQRSGFELYYSSTFDRWIFNRYDADSTSAAIVRAQSTAVPQVNTWTHLVGVYDATAQQIRLYVNGTLAQTTTYTTPWNATGVLQLGVGWYGSRNNFFGGDVDDVRIFDQPINDSEIAQLAGVAGGGIATADDGPLGNHATLGGNAFIDQSNGWIGDPTAGLVLDGNGDYAATAGPVVHTNQSFTIAGWATGAPTANAAIFSQAGLVNSGFTLRYSPASNGGAGGYQLEMPDKDATGANRPVAEHPNFQSALQWDHVAIVYDAFADKMTLYVNGRLQDEEPVSWKWNVVGFDATKGFQIGRSFSDGVWGEYWPGVIDDVWAFSGVLSQDQIQQLAFSSEELDSSTF